MFFIIEAYIGAHIEHTMSPNTCNAPPYKNLRSKKGSKLYTSEISALTQVIKPVCLTFTCYKPKFCIHIEWLVGFCQAKKTAPGWGYNGRLTVMWVMPVVAKIR